MPDLPSRHRPGHRLRRRTFLRDLGRVSLGAVVLGPVLAGCAEEAEAPAAGGGSPSDGGATAAGLRWERASFGFVSAYVVVRDGEALVFDTGTGDDGVGAITDALDAVGAGWGDVSSVLVSHNHGDHAGGVEAVATEAPDAAFRAGMPDLDSFRDAVATAEEVVDGDTLLGLRVVATPGHTLGHVSAIDEQSGLLLAGDAIVRDREIGGTTGQGIEASPPDFTADTEQALASVGVLADLAPATIVFGHGDPLAEDAASELQAYADTL